MSTENKFLVKLCVNHPKWNVVKVPYHNLDAHYFLIVIAKTKKIIILLKYREISYEVKANSYRKISEYWLQISSEIATVNISTQLDKSSL